MLAEKISFRVKRIPRKRQIEFFSPGECRRRRGGWICSIGEATRSPEKQRWLTLRPMAAILLVEDDSRIRHHAANVLAGAGHDVETAGSALDGLRLAVANKPDLVILDLGLPDLDGAEMLRMLRAVSQVPVIVATAREGDSHVVAALDSGADDYLVKPFSTAELEARVRAVLRRRQVQSADSTVEVAGLFLDRAKREARLDGTPIDLSPKEFDLLLMLAERSGDVVSKREMMAEVWRQPYGGGERTVDVHLSSLRSKLGESARRPRYLQTVHGVGVKLVDPET
jgi:DNA-binding response OmpR family regulator